MKLYYTPQTIYFKTPFKIAHGSRNSTNIVLVELHYNGLIGYGEASLPPYLPETQQSVIAFFEKSRTYLEQLSIIDAIETMILHIHNINSENRSAKAALDIALFDLYGKTIQQPCWKLFGCEKDNTPNTSFTIGIDSKQAIEQKIIDGNDFKLFKVKLNGENDEEIINTIRNKTDKPISVDVNQGWKDKSVALKKIEWMVDKNVVLIEQPLPKNNWDDALWLYEKSPLPVFADEAMQQFSDLEKVKHCFDGINIKLMKCGGLYMAKKIITEARKNNLKILLGCMTETSCAISAAAQLSSLVDYCDLDSPMLITNDLFKGITFEKGKIILNDYPGIGVFIRD